MDQLLITTKSHLPLPIQNLHYPDKNRPDLEQARQIHAHFIKTQFNHINFAPPNNLLQPHLISSAAKNNFLITSYVNNSHPENAIKIYTHMRRMDSAEVDNFTLSSVLKACSLVSSIMSGKEIHGFMVKNGFSIDVFACNALIHMYSECGSLLCARLVFDKMPSRDAVSWSTMIRSYSRNRLFYEALEIVREMNVVGMKPSDVAMISIVDILAEILDMKMGKEMHGYIIKNGHDDLKFTVPTSTALIDMYSRCGNLALARRLFDALTHKNIIAWAAMIAGYIRSNRLEEGTELYRKMLEDGIFPNEIMMLSLITECRSVAALEMGKWLHAQVLRNGVGMTLALATALVAMYGKCGEIRYARVIFDRIVNRDVMIWSSMISAYARVSCIDEAFDLFAKMRNDGLKPNNVTTVSLLSLCAESGALDLGKWVHAYINQQGVEMDVRLQTALLNMYAKCGDIERAQRLFYEARKPDVGMWNAMMAGFAIHGYGREALNLFLEIEREGVVPNDITFIGVLHACSHAGLVAEGKRHFRKMVDCYGLAPKIEHYGCMADLLGRVGDLNELHDFIRNMPIRPNLIVWGALLAACKLHKNLVLGEVAASKILQMEPENCGYNVLMSNMYAASKRWNEVTRVRTTMKSMGVKKEPGLSCIEINGSVHGFIMGDKAHSHTEQVYEMLDEMSKKLKDAGYMSDTTVVLRNIEEEEKETAVTYHSEKLAMAFGLISTADGTPIRVVKNLRICDDCHNATKLLSKIYGRTITVRDRNRFHHFIEGSCSCNDYW